MMLAVTVSQVLALLSSALCGGGSSAAADDDTKVAGAAADGGELWGRRCRLNDRAAAGYCCVCISVCRDVEEVRRLPCGHAFHRDCVERWLARCRRRTCPLCRTHVGGGGGLVLVTEEQQHELSDDLIIWFSSLFIVGL